MITTLTSVGRSAEGSNLLTSQTSISATSGKFGCRKFSNDINLISQPSLSIYLFCLFSPSVPVSLSVCVSHLGYPSALIISVRLRKSLNAILEGQQSVISFLVFIYERLVDIFSIYIFGTYRIYIIYWYLRYAFLIFSQHSLPPNVKCP